MLKIGMLGLAAAISFSPAAANAQPAPGGSAAPPQPDPAAMAKHVADLLAQCPEPPTVPEAEAAVLPIHVTKWGTTGPRVLIIHGGVQGGTGGGPATFDKQQAWEQDWRVEIVDRPGFGGSPTRGADDMNRDTAWIAAMLGDGANLIGHSWGGVEALLAAARRPEAVRSLVLVEPALSGVLAVNPEFRNDPAVQAGGVERMKLLMTAQTPGEYGRGFLNMLGSAAGGNAIAARFEHDPDLATRSGCALLQGRMASAEATENAIQKVVAARIPVLVVTGGYSPSFDAAGKVLARLIHGRHLIVPSPNHFVQLMNATDFNHEVANFMQEADRTRPSPPTNKP